MHISKAVKVAIVIAATTWLSATMTAASDSDDNNNDNDNRHSNDYPAPSPSNSESSDYDSRDDVRGGDGACGCHECTDKILNRDAGGYTCGERILYLMEGPHQLDEKEACIRVARTEFASICGPKCDPGRCDGKTWPGEEMPSTYCGCKKCNHKVWQAKTADGYTCGARITYLTDFYGFSVSEACNIVGGHEFVEECGKCDPAQCEPIHGPDTKFKCGCSRCTEAVWNLDVDGATCGERIEYLLNNNPDEYPTEKDACRQVAQFEFPHRCGTNCDPDYCDAPLTARTPLYCFPKFDDRKRFRNVWTNFTVEVKESADEVDGVCGPQNNIFSTNTVHRINKHQIKLQFKKVGEKWEGSEIRIRRPEPDMPFRYGIYSFSVKSVQVVDANTGEIESDILPPSLVLSMHTWDGTENFAIHENQNHQVSIDVSRLDASTGPDARFVVQPAIEFNTYQFYTGDDKNYKQSPGIYKFDWRPAKVEFYSDGGEAGEESTYSTQRAIRKGEPDYTQCLPADAEVRINLWNIYGSLPPTDMANSPHLVVEVVIDEFSYTPSGLEYVPDGGICSKDCHCSPDSKCFGNLCTPESQYSSIDSFFAAYNGQPTASKPPMHVIIGLSIFGCCVIALVVIAYRRFRRKDHVLDGRHVASFKCSPEAVKG